MNGKFVQPFAAMRLVSRTAQPLKLLSGFLPHYRIPRSVAEGRKFLAQLVKDELNQDLQTTFDSLRTVWRWKRKEISAFGPEDCLASIETPCFSYEVSVDFSEGEPDTVIWSRTVSNIRDLSQVFSHRFQDVFGSQFTCMEVALPNPLDIESVIDKIEEIESDQFSLSYDKDCTRCEIGLDRSNGLIRVEPDRLLISSQSPESTPQRLVEALAEFQNQLVEILIPQPAGKDG